MNFPQNLKYTNEHEWIRVDGDIAYVGTIGRYCVRRYPDCW